MTIFAKRLKELRKKSGLTQEKLGVLAGIDEFTASVRVSQYESGKHIPEFSVVERLANILEAPEGYFFTKDDISAQILLKLHKLKKNQKLTILAYIDE